jgi:hypothetical protein
MSTDTQRNRITSESLDKQSNAEESIEIFYDDVGKLDYAECKSKEARAKWLDNQRVKHYTEDKIYHVKSDSDKMYTVNFNTKLECICIAKTNCVHILACKYSNGEEICARNPVRIALSKLVASKRNNKASGKKHLNNVKEKQMKALNNQTQIIGNIIF